MSKQGKRPPEYASKVAHGYVVNDSYVREFLKNCTLPRRSSDISFDDFPIVQAEAINSNPIKHIIAIDGGYTEVVVQHDFPSAQIAFFQFGALQFSVRDLENLEQIPFIDPADIQKLKNIERLKFAIPIKNISYKNGDLVDSIRRNLYEFFLGHPDSDSFMETLQWLLFREYGNPRSEWKLATCPAGMGTDRHYAMLKRDSISSDHTFHCDRCGAEVLLTDVFRLHEAIDNELGAGGILGYLMTTMEQVLLVHLIRLILQTMPGLLNEVMFIKDGPLGFFGQTARMHEPVRDLMNHLRGHNNIYLVGMEKSGAFVDHAHEIEQKLEPGQVLLLSNDYIYKYVIPGNANPMAPYAGTSYYGTKLIYRSRDARTYVVTVPTADREVVLNPRREDFPNLDVLLWNLDKLRCDMYDDALLPVALANKLVSLSNHPSSRILEKFAQQGIS